MALSPKRGRPTLRASGKPFTEAERKRRHRASLKRKAKAALEVARRSRRVEVVAELGILPLAIADIAELHLSSSSVDAVITDPPYAEVEVPLYGDLAHFAMRVLKPGGWCIALAGDLYLDRLLPLLTDAGLVWRGLLEAYYPGGAHARIAATANFENGRAILALQKGPKSKPPYWSPRIMAIQPGEYDKSLHEWQQSRLLFERLVERFTREGDLVADPFAGAGTTLRAALALNRRAWGSDIDACQRTFQPPQGQQRNRPKK